MLIVALVLAVIGLAALVTAVVTSNELIAWVCIGASVIGVLLLIVDALRERSKGAEEVAATDDAEAAAAPEDETTVIPAVAESEAAEDYPDEPIEPVEASEAKTEAEAETSTVAVEAHDDVSPKHEPD